MGIIGSFGGVSFKVSDKQVLTFSELSRSKESRWETIDVIGHKPKKVFIGPSLEKITFSVVLSATLNVNPEKVLNKWYSMIDSGKISRLLLKNKPVGRTYFSLESIAVSDVVIDNVGAIWKQTVALTLEEYPKKAKVPSKKKMKKKKATAKTKKNAVGTIVIKVKSVHIRSGPSIKNKVVGYAFKNKKLTVYKKVDGWYALGNGKYITANPSYSTFKSKGRV